METFTHTICGKRKRNSKRNKLKESANASLQTFSLPKASSSSKCNHKLKLTYTNYRITFEHNFLYPSYIYADNSMYYVVAFVFYLLHPVDVFRSLYFFSISISYDIISWKRVLNLRHIK